MANMKSPLADKPGNCTPLYSLKLTRYFSLPSADALSTLIRSAETPCDLISAAPHHIILGTFLTIPL
ncbi:MAG: hypothetical protein AB4352_01410 [Hormoscilla sp.]